MGLLRRYERLAIDLAPYRSREPKMRLMGAMGDPEFVALMEAQQREWAPSMRKIMTSGEPYAGLGFAQVEPKSNAELVTTPAATTGVTAETNLYTPATTTNADWALIPAGDIRSPQTWIIRAAGVYTSSSTSQTCAFTQRIGTSATPSSNASIGATGAISLGNATAVTNGIWQYECIGLVTAVGSGTNGTVKGTTNIMVSNQAAGSITACQTGLAGNTSASIDTTIQQGFVISATPSAVGVSVTLQQFVMFFLD